MAAPAFVAPFCCARKPRGYWLDSGNVLREVTKFQVTHGGDTGVLPTASALLEAGRADLCRAVQRQGGFARCAQRIGLAPARRPRGYWTRALPDELNSFAAANGVAPGSMPSTTALRRSGRTDILNAVQAAGGVHEAARGAGLRAVSSLRVAPLRPPRVSRSLVHRPRNTWRDWPALRAELRAFAEAHCDGRMPFQRELAAAGRHDLINAMRAHGGLLKVATAAGLTASAVSNPRRPRGYWAEWSRLEEEMRAYTAKYGLPGLMPRRDQLLRAGRRDLCYAVEKYGGFSAVSRRLRLVWVGPSNFWRQFRNLRKRLMEFVRMHGPKGIMPTVLRLHQMGRIDLVYGIALHGGVMTVAEKVGLRVRYAKRKPEYWEHPRNITKELQWFMETQALENRMTMPSSVALVQAGRADLAIGVRDHGGWVYYAQRLGLRFGFAQRVKGFWQNEENVLRELMFYVDERYGTWEHPGALPDGATVGELKQLGVAYVPSVEMLKRDGRSDIAFAVQRYQGGEQEFARRHILQIATDTVEVQPVEEMKKWVCFSKEIEQWIFDYGANGIMPTREDFIRTGRHDLRCAMFLHGGDAGVARRIGLVFCREKKNWLGSWLALQAAKMGTVLNFEANASETTQTPEAIRKMNQSLKGCTLGKRCRALKETANFKKPVIIKKRRRRRKSRKKGGVPVEKPVAAKKPSIIVEKGSLGQISLLELDVIRKRYEHLRSDDIINP